MAYVSENFDFHDAISMRYNDMDESPNFYFSEEEVKSILFAMAMTIGESVVESDCDAIFKKIKQVYPDTIKKYEYILDMNIFWKSPPNMKTFGEK